MDKDLLRTIPSVYTCISNAEATSNMSNLTGIIFAFIKPSGMVMDGKPPKFPISKCSSRIVKSFVANSSLLPSK